MRGILLGILAPVITDTALAQAVALNPGTRVRIETKADRKAPVIGAVARLSNDSIVVIPDRMRGETALALADIHEISISRGKSRGRSALYGAGWGFLIAGGALALVIAADDPGWAFVGPIFAGPPGALLGLVVGSSRAKEHWQKLPPPYTRSGAALLPHSPQLHHQTPVLHDIYSLVSK